VGVREDHADVPTPPTYVDGRTVISTYVYRRAFEGGEYSFSAAVGLFNSVILTSSVIIVVLIKIQTKRVSGR